MSGFSAQWLALREPYDRRARNAAVLDALREHIGAAGDIAVVDLACGTGSTLRALSPLLPARQEWRLADHDLGLLARAKEMDDPPALRVTTVAVDLDRDLEMALDGPLDLVTTSALLDLVSADWLERLAVEAAARKLPVYAALTYDGRMSVSPQDGYDATMIAAFNRHQRRDKGFGPALGPTAAAAAVEAFARVGYAVADGPSDWVFTPDDREIQLQLLRGWADAAHELGDLDRGEVENWHARRRRWVEEGRAQMLVGHQDVFARPNGKR